MRREISAAVMRQICESIVTENTCMGGSRKAWDIARVSMGNFLEMYDFMVFGYYAASIAKTYFPSGSEFLSLMLSLRPSGPGF
jgi:hypothetical protein